MRLFVKADGVNNLLISEESDCLIFSKNYCIENQLFMK